MFSKLMNVRAFMLLALVLVTTVAWAKDKPEEQEEGTSAEDVAKLQLPAPNTVKVAVLPFWDYSSKAYHTRIASGASWMLLDHHGFQMIDILETFKAFAADKEVEPGVALRKGDAIRMAKTLGANWVIYGEVRELRSYTKQSLLKASKKMNVSMRISVANVDTGENVYWKVRSDNVGGTGGPLKKSSSLARIAVQSTTERIFESFLAALPKHELKGSKPENGDLLGFVNKNWPDADKD